MTTTTTTTTTMTYSVMDDTESSGLIVTVEV